MKGLFSFAYGKFRAAQCLSCKFSVESKKLYSDELAIDVGKVVHIRGRVQKFAA